MQRPGVQFVRMLLLLIGSVVFMIPLLWMFSTAIKPIDQTMTVPPKWLPTRTVTTIDGQPVEVGVGKIPDGAGPDSIVPITATYQYIVGRSPVRVIEETAPNHVVVEVNYHLEATIDGKEYPVRRVDALDSQPGIGEVEVAVIYPDGSMRRRLVQEKSIRKIPDNTADAVSKSYSFTEQESYPADAAFKRYVPWNDRQKYAHVMTENRTAALRDLDDSTDIQWGNFPAAVREMKHFWVYLGNTLILCLLTVIGTATSSAVVAYGFSRIDWPGRDKVFLFVLGTMMIPLPVVMVPLYSLFRELGWIGTLRPLWVPAFFAGAFNVFLLRQFFKTIPGELSEAARIDGCSEFRIFLQVIVPLAKPSITVVALFQFLYTWNDFLGPLIYLTDEKDYTLALALQAFQSQQGGTQWHYLMAASTLVVAPIIFLFFLTQRTFIEGVSMSGLKG